MAWFAIYDTNTGSLKSITTIVSDILPVGWTALALAGKPNDSTMWDSATHAFIPRPTKSLIDRLDDLQTSQNQNAVDFRTVWITLLPAQKSAIRNAFIWLIGRKRFRNAADTPDIND